MFVVAGEGEWRSTGVLGVGVSGAGLKDAGESPHDACCFTVGHPPPCILHNDAEIYLAHLQGGCRNLFAANRALDNSQSPHQGPPGPPLPLEVTKLWCLKMKGK